MSDEKRMRELLQRLVAMSPQPPQFPLETPLTRPDKAGRTRPLVMFAGAAVVVLLLAAIPLLLLGDRNGRVVGTTTSTVPGTVTTEPEATTSTSEEPTSTTVPMTEVGVVVYLTQEPENAFLPNPALVPFRSVLPAPKGTSSTEASLRVLTIPDLITPDGFGASVPAGLVVNSVVVSPEVRLVTVDFAPQFLRGAGGLLADFTMLNQIVYTATQFGELESVLFTVEGRPVDQFGSEGLDLSEPVGRDTFVDNLNLINITAPVGGNDSEGALLVQGLANVFEASVIIEVLDEEGQVVYQDFATATCGTGCWGSFTHTIDYPFTGTETVRVYQASAEDGSPTNVVTVPVLWKDDDGWDLLP